MNSSTSTSDGETAGLPGCKDSRRFLKNCLGTAAGLIAASVLVNGWALLVTGDIDGLGLVSRQRERAERLSGTELVLIGDSSLGNAIDANALGELLGVKTVNLALTGLFGFVGGQRLLETVPVASRPTRVVVMQTSDMLTRPPSDLGSVAVAPGLGLDISRARFSHELAAAANYVWRPPHLDVLRRLVGFPAGAMDPATDYVRQGTPRVDASTSALVLRREDIRADKVDEMRRLARWCADRGLEAWYFHGPIDAGVAERSSLYYEAANQLLAEAGFRIVAPRPLALRPSAIGDTEDHVRPQFRLPCTTWHAQAIREAWAQEDEEAHPSAPSLDYLGF